MLPKLTYEEKGWRKTLAYYRIMYLGLYSYDEIAEYVVKRMIQSANYVMDITRNVDIHDIYEMGHALEFGCVTEGIDYDDRDILRIISALGEAGITDTDSLASYKSNPKEIYGIGKKYAKMIKAAKSVLSHEPLKNCRVCLMISGKALERLDIMADAEHMSRSACLERVIEHEWYSSNDEY